MNTKGIWKPDSWAKGIHFDLENIKNVPVEDFYKINDQNFFTAAFDPELFRSLSLIRKETIEKYLWCSNTNLYYDWDVKNNQRSVYRTCTALWALWAEIPDVERARLLVKACMENFKVTGGLVSGTEDSRGQISLERPNRQWDFPCILILNFRWMGSSSNSSLERSGSLRL